MGATFRHDGRRIPYTPEADVAAGDVVVLGGLVGIATCPIAADELGSLAIEGVFEIAKHDDEDVIADVGEHAYWDSSDEVVTDLASGNTPIGHFTRRAEATDATAHVRLCQGLISDSDGSGS